VWAWAISVNGGPRDRSAHGRSGQGLGAKDRLSSLKEALPLRLESSRWENASKGGIAVKKVIVRLALIGSSISAIVLAGGAGKGLR